MGSFSNFNSAHLNLILSKDKQQFFDIKVEKTSNFLFAPRRNVTPCKGIQDSQDWILNSSQWIAHSRYWIPNFVKGIQISDSNL